MSSKQVLFRTDRPFEPGSPIELSIEWPVSLDDNTRLQLNIQGDIIRSRGIWTLVTVLKHEFRTRGMRSVAHPAGHAESPYTARRQSELLQVAGAAH
ncbi:MAG TPA: hypothetical protein VG675_04275 [Bryobacteraceae bacterium]|nr:hypothetical protein [Bryobacteraceae bacterium]